MGSILSQVEGSEQTQVEPVRCPVCAHPNEPGQHCRHVRWTFDQGGPIEFAQFAVETSPYVRARNHRPDEITRSWWELNAEWVAEKVMLYFDARDGLVFGELVYLDLLTRDIWKHFMPEDAQRPRLFSEQR